LYYRLETAVYKDEIRKKTLKQKLKFTCKKDKKKYDGTEPL